MSDQSDERRDRLHAFLQGEGPGDHRATGALLTGWVIVAAWVDPNGESWLTKAHAAELAHWTAAGMHHEALYADWGGDG